MLTKKNSATPPSAGHVLTTGNRNHMPVPIALAKLANGGLAVALLALSQGVLAQQLPGGGSQIQQLPPVPAPQAAPPEIRIQEGKPPNATDTSNVKVLVKSLRVTGSRVYSEDALLALTGFVPNTELTLADLEAMAARISKHYRQNGYFVARAYLPAQNVTDNAITIAVSEGQYGKIVLRNETNLSDDLARKILDGVNSGDTITNDTLESRLLLLSDVPGVKVNSTLVPGEAPGSSDLLVDITPGRRVTGSVDADNAGNRYTGEYRLGGTVNVNNLLGRGDVFSLRAVTSGSGLNYGRASYQMQFGKATGGVAYSRLNYKLGKEFAPLLANGTVEVYSIYGSYPLIRSRNSNLSVGLNYDYKSFRDRVDAFASVTDKKINVLTASLYGNHRDTLGGGGVNSYLVSLSAGKLDIQTPAARAADAASAMSQGDYSQLAFRASRLQRVTDNLSLFAEASGQVASKNLDASEKMSLGGIDGVRAYPQGEGYGDEGYLVKVEARLLLPKPKSLPGAANLIGFVESGSVTINKKPWAAGVNQRSLGAYGLGLTYGEPGNFAIRMYYARKLSDTAAISAPDRSGRFWIQAIKYF